MLPVVIPITILKVSIQQSSLDYKSLTRYVVWKQLPVDLHINKLHNSRFNLKLNFASL